VIASGRLLAGHTVVVTRATDQAGALAVALAERGATVVELPVVAIDDPADGGVALDAALDAALERGSAAGWLVVTSPNGARRAVDRLAGRPWPGQIAAVGPKTAEPLLGAGLVVDLVPDRAVAEGLLEDFPAPTDVGQRVLLARAEVARDVLPDGLCDAGFEVDVVTAYRNVEPTVDPEVLAAAADADLVIFTSESTVHRFTAMVSDRRPTAAVCIGPVSGAAARHAGYDVAEADPHSMAGLVAAVERWASGSG